MKKIILSIIFSFCIMQETSLIHAFKNPFQQKETSAPIMPSREQIIIQYHRKCANYLDIYCGNDYLTVLLSHLTCEYNEKLKEYNYPELQNHEIIIKNS